MRNQFFTATIFGLGVTLGAAGAWADGTETLAAATVGIVEGTGIAAGGTGLIAQPGQIDITIPGGATVEQVLLYWECQMSTDVAGDDTIDVDGTSVTGALIGGQTFFFNGAYSSTFRADITGLGLVGAGPNSLMVEGLNCTEANNGAGVLVIFDDGSDLSDIQVRDGNDLAFINFAPTLDATVPQAFSFASAAFARTATLANFFSSVSGSVSGGGLVRPSSVEVNTGGEMTLFSNELDSLDLDEWDTLELSVNVPAGATMLTIQAFSRDDSGDGQVPLAASFAWITSAFAITPPSGGGEGCTPGFWRSDQHLEFWPPTDPNALFSAVFENAFGSSTLLQVVRLKGGGLNRLGAHTVAALVNAASPDVDYDLSVTEVIDAFNAVFPGTKSAYNAQKNIFEALNEQPCPLG